MRKVLSLILAVLCLAGCAKNQENLKLENVLEFEAKRAERLKAKETAKAAAPAVPVIAASPVPVVPIASASPVPVFNFEPSELSEFHAPAGFVLMNEAELKEVSIFPKLLFAPTAGWKNKDFKVMLLTSMTKMDPTRLGLMNKKDFMADVEKTGREYSAFYQQNYTTPSASEVKEEDEVLSLKVTSKYLEENVWKTDVRYIYFYRPDYRLNVLITGKDEDVAFHWKEIQKSLDSFLKKIRADYVLPIPFRQSLEEANS